MNLLERINHWGAAAPRTVAYICGDRTLTYGELHRRSDALAAHLAERFGDDNAPIAVLGHREPEMLIAFLGAVKSGRPYVPIDTAFPPQRVNKVLAISRAVVVLTPEEIAQMPAVDVPAPVSYLQRDDPF